MGGEELREQMEAARDGTSQGNTDAGPPSPGMLEGGGRGSPLPFGGTLAPHAHTA